MMMRTVPRRADSDGQPFAVRVRVGVAWRVAAALAAGERGWARAAARGACCHLQGRARPARAAAAVARRRGRLPRQRAVQRREQPPPPHPPRRLRAPRDTAQMILATVNNLYITKCGLP